MVKLTEKQTIRANELVRIVQSYFTKLGVNIPFFIAGGSIFSILNDRPFNDIDVYFYTENDFLTLNKRVRQQDIIVTTPNAITIHYSSYTLQSRTIQLIKRNFGSMEDIFTTFDISCSKVAYTSNNELVIGKDFSYEIKCDLNNIHNQIIKRYHKYVIDKNAIDTDNLEGKRIIRYIIQNKNIQVTNYYTKGKCSCISLLKFGYENSRYSFNQFIHDEICNFYNSSDRLKIFEKLSLYTANKINPGGVEGILSIQTSCDENLVFYYLRVIEARQYIDIRSRNDTFQISQRQKEVMHKYPEYFI